MVHPKCEELGCTKKTNQYGYPGGEKQFCSKHKKIGMIDLAGKGCAHEGCKVRHPGFNLPNSTGLYCKKHALDDMVDVRNKSKCVVEGCNTTPNYNLPGKKARYCVEHASPLMKNVNCKECEVDDCKTQPTYDWLGGKGVRCALHQIKGMENVVNTDLCEHVGDDGTKCKIRPTFNLEGQPAKFCKKHSTDLMIDVKNKRCEHIGCDKINPTFGFKGETRGHFCKQHKEPGMKDVVNRHLCKFKGCTKRPTFDFPGGKGKYCTKHKEDSMVDIKNKRCLTCPTVAHQAYMGHCYRCFIHTYPDNTIVRNHKTKERVVADFVRNSYQDLTVLLDKVIPGGTSNRRPDIYIDLRDRVLVVEIDENQHGTYDCTCENKRLAEMFVDAGSRPLTMIRFNPDKYKDHGGIKVPSCWDYTSERRLAVVGNVAAWNRRLNVLKHTIDFVENSATQKEMDVIHLFYDGWKD